MKNLVLTSGDLSDLTVNPAKTIFWVGAGVGVLSPCNLPLGNDLTDVILGTALGAENKKRLINIWNHEFPRIRDCVQKNNWRAPFRKRHGTSDSGTEIPDLGERPRLEFIIGEINKLDVEFQDIIFQKESNKAAYRRDSIIKALKHFSDAEPNIYHYALADFLNAGAIAVTTNFDVCIEKALGLNTDEMQIKTVNGVKAVEYAAGKYVYHIHGVATDEDIETNLGATLTNVSKSLSKQFTEELCRLLKENYTLIFIGYGGVDFFDIKPFFDGLGEQIFPGKAIYLHYCRNTECSEAVKKEKNYQYLLTPFQEQIICYGDTEVFQEALSRQSGVKKADYAISSGTGCALAKTTAALTDSIKAYSNTDKEKYWFINMFRIASQLNVSMKYFYPDWPKRLAVIYSDWKNDAPDSGTLCKMILEPKEITRCVVDDIRNNNWYSREPVYIEIVKDITQIFQKREKPVGTGSVKISFAELERATEKYVEQACAILETEATSSDALELETAVVQYLCGPYTNNLLKQWLLHIHHRNRIEKQLQVLLRYMDQLLSFSYNKFLYMTFYIGLSRRRHIINAILNKKTTKGSDGRKYTDSGELYSSRTKCYGNIQLEWNICMETPNLFDAGKIIEGILLQYACRIAKVKWVNPCRAYGLYKIKREIIALRED